MVKSLRCRDVGPDCDFKAMGATDDEILAQTPHDAREAHGFEEIAPELTEKVHAAIRTESVATA